MKVLKKIAIAILIILLLLLGLLLFAPYIFKDKIIEITRTELNKNLNADTDFKDIDLSFFKDFPNLSLSIEELSIVGRNEFSGDTLLHVPSFLSVINIGKAISGELEITKLLIDEPLVYIKTNRDGLSNYETIVISDSTTPNEQTSSGDTESEEAGNMQLSLRSFAITKARIKYEDLTNHTEVALQDLDLKLAGDFSAQRSQMTMHLLIPSLNLTADSSTMIEGARIELDSELDADFANSKFTLLKNQLSLNRLACQLEGWLQVNEENIDMDLKLKTLESTFASLLDLVPQDFQHYYKGVEATGDLILEGSIVGKYTTENLPAFELIVKTNKASLQYPDLPEPIQDIGIDIQISHPDQTDADHTTIAVNDFSCRLGNNKLQSNWHVTKPVSDPNIKGALKGNMKFQELAKAIPIDDLKMKGLLNFDFNLNGKLSSLEQEKYEDFTFSGKSSLESFVLNSSQLKQDLLINKMVLNCSSKAITLSQCNAKIGDSDFQLDGELNNYLPYLIKDDATLRGKINLNSNFLNIDEMMELYIEEQLEATTQAQPAGEKSEKTTTQTGASEEIQIPANLDIQLAINIKKLTYLGIQTTQAHGKMFLKDSRADLSQLTVNMLDGLVSMKGIYDTKNAKKHNVDLNLVLNSLSMNKTTSNFNSVSKFAPILEKVQGIFSASLDFKSDLDSEFSPLLETVNCYGKFNSQALSMTNSPLLEKLVQITGNKTFSSLMAKPFEAEFSIKDGQMEVKPFEVSVNGKKASIWGKHSLNQNMDYYIRIPVKPSDLKEEYAKVLSALSTQNDEVPITIHLNGDILNPQMGLDLTEAKEILKNSLKDKAGDKIKDLFNKIR